MFTLEAYTRTSILDCLNEDCWRAVLQYVPIRDIILTERASHRWQQAMLTYLQEVRIGIESRGFRVSKELCKVRRIMRWEIPEHSFERWTYKLGTSIVVTYCMSEEMLKIISKNCPHIEVLTICDPEGKLLLNKYNENFNCLRKLSFERCYSVSDKNISEFIGNKALEELRVVNNKQVTGECLINMESGMLKSLTLDSCRLIQPHHLQIATQRLNELTKLELIELPSKFYELIPALLINMPKLEFLSIIEFEFDFVDVDDYFESISKLSYLKNLRLHVQELATAGLEKVTQCCEKLRFLDIRVFGDFDCARRLKAVCQNAGPRLTTLGFTYCSELIDDDILSCIRTCPKLTLLDVSSCKKLTPMLLAHAAATRREMGTQKRLRLFVDDTSMLHYYGMDFKELIIDRCMCTYKI